MKKYLILLLLVTAPYYSIAQKMKKVNPGELQQSNKFATRPERIKKQAGNTSKSPENLDSLIDQVTRDEPFVPSDYNEYFIESDDEPFRTDASMLNTKNPQNDMSLYDPNSNKLPFLTYQFSVKETISMIMNIFNTGNTDGIPNQAKNTLATQYKEEMARCKAKQGSTDYFIQSEQETCYMQVTEVLLSTIYKEIHNSFYIAPSVMPSLYDSSAKRQIQSVLAPYFKVEDQAYLMRGIRTYEIKSPIIRKIFFSGNTEGLSFYIKMFNQSKNKSELNRSLYLFLTHLDYTFPIFDKYQKQTIISYLMKGDIQSSNNVQASKTKGKKSPKKRKKS